MTWVAVGVERTSLWQDRSGNAMMTLHCAALDRFWRCGQISWANTVTTKLSNQAGCLVWVRLCIQWSREHAPEHERDSASVLSFHMTCLFVVCSSEPCGQSPREIIFVVIRQGEVGKEVPIKNRHQNSCAVSKHYFYLKTGLVDACRARSGRAGQYRKHTSIERSGAVIRLPDLRKEIAQCAHRFRTDRYQIVFAEILK
jgi:hypothetical protein